MRPRRTIIVAALAAVALAGCQDPRGAGMSRKEKLTAMHPQEFPGHRFQGGFEDPSAVSKPRPNEGVASPEAPAPRYDERLQDLPGIGGAGADHPFALEDPSSPVPAERLDNVYGGYDPLERSRNSEYWGPAAPEQSGDAPEAPDRRLNE